MYHIYCISGLGADKRIFNRLSISNAQLHFIDWVLPQKSDTMRSYALRLAEQISHKEIILAGVSFGGMLASEISRVYEEYSAGETAEVLPFKLLKTILISSCRHPGEYPAMMQAAARMKLHKLAPYRVILRSTRLNRFVFDLQSKEEEVYLKRVMLASSSLELIKRSINIIFTWKASPYHNLVHIHGTADRLFPPKKLTPDYWIKGGGHFMVWNRAEEVSEILKEVIEQLPQ